MFFIVFKTISECLTTKHYFGCYLKKKKSVSDAFKGTVAKNEENTR